MGSDTRVAGGEFGASSDSVLLADLIRAVQKRVKMVVFICIAFTFLGCGYAFLATEWFRADVLLIPAGKSSGEGLSGQLGDLGGIGALVGLAGLGLGNEESVEPLAVLKSNELAKEFIDKLGLLPKLFPKKWDAHAQRWIGSDATEWPDDRDGVKYLSEKILEVDEDKKAGLIKVSVYWTDSETAASWANYFVELLNNRMRQRAIDESERNLAFLSKELESTTLVSMQQSISKLMERELQRLMMARGNEDFAYRFIDHAVSPKKRSWPIRSLVIALALFVGVMLSIVAALLFDARDRARQLESLSKV